MIASRFRSIGWVAGCAFAALCCYLASQSVAAERAALVRVDREIEATGYDIGRLNTEIAARGRMGQIERWNKEVLALQAPAPGQFVENEVKLASLAGGQKLELDPAVVASKGAVATVAYQPDAPKPAVAGAPAPVATAVAQPMLRRATFVQATGDRLANMAEAPIVKASLTRPVIAVPPVEDQPALSQRAAPVAAVKKDAPAAAKKPAVAGKDPPKAATAVAAHKSTTSAPLKANGERAADREEKVAKVDKRAADRKPAPEKKVEPKLTLARADVDKPARAKPLATASLLPSDLGKLIAAEKKGAKAAPRTAGER